MAKIVGILDKPSPKSFGLCPILTKSPDEDFYRSPSFTPKKLVNQEEFGMLGGGHMLEVDILLPGGLSNPGALWVGKEFSVWVESLQAPSLPEMKGWNEYSLGKEIKGWYSIREWSEAYGVLEGWVGQTAILALDRMDGGLAGLMNWTLPFDPKTQAALYFTQPTDELKQKELDWQLKLRRDARNPISEEELIALHEETRESLYELD